MKPSREAPKIARTTAAPDETGEDRISSFPDSVLCNILSFLPTKYAATTSVLSTRWKYLFLGVSKIDLDDSLFIDDLQEIDEPLLTEPQEIQGSGIYESQDFINFVNRRLVLCQTPSITEFRLKCLELPEAPVTNLWLTMLLLRKIQVLEIEVQSLGSPPLCPPYGFFRLETLVVLKLCGPIIVFKIPEFVSFPNLKVLHLVDLNMQFESNHFRLAEEGYPLLEDLRLELIKFQKKNKEDENDAILGISLHTLKKLAIIGVGEKVSCIAVDAPHLQHLECSVRGSAKSIVEITLYKPKSLVSAEIYIPLPCASFNIYSQWVIDLLTEVNNVKELHLSAGWNFSQVLYIIAKPPPGFPVRSLLQFPNLTHLELATADESVWVLLQSTPNLTALVCNTGALIWHERRHGKSLTPENEPRCLARTLREIRVRGFRENPDVFAMVGFLLQRGAVLEKMILERSEEVEEWQSSTLKQLLNLERRSPRCAIELV